MIVAVEAQVAPGAWRVFREADDQARAGRAVSSRELRLRFPLAPVSLAKRFPFDSNLSLSVFLLN